MSDEELDTAIAERFKAYEAGIHLPGEFKGRLVSSVRRKRVLRRLCVLGLVCIMAITCGLIVSFARPAVTHGDMKPMLMAQNAPKSDTVEVSCWMLLGYLRECFTRSRSARRKEEE